MARGQTEKQLDVEVTSLDLDDSREVSQSIVQYVARTGETVVLDHAGREGMFVGDAHIQKHQCKSVLCLPILNRGILVAVVYLENNKIPGAFHWSRLEILELMMTPAAVAIISALDKDSGSSFRYQVGGSLAVMRQPM